MRIAKAEKNLTLSLSAIKRLNDILVNKPKGTFLRVEVVPGGCQGFNVKFSLDSNINEDDKQFTFNNITLVSDDTSLGIIAGSTVEYSSSLMGKYFWLNVTNSKSKCSCGSSFSI